MNRRAVRRVRNQRSKFRGFNLRTSLIRVSKWILRKIRIRNRSRYHYLGGTFNSPMNKFFKWVRNLGVKSLMTLTPKSGYTYLGSETDLSVPKGHLAVYVGQKEGELHRVLVPVIYFNHPLFGELLKEAEEEFGFQQEGGITIPCRFTEFERVKTGIASGSRRTTRRKGFAWRR
ncbi:hypothetical protein Fmac_010930 [Flemingia macrophylla]|uniref:Small auxin up regulated protein n=1 Tax=Flemingia macrophylla TaxID=520843 RepID=A0ABD1ML43_9FABA